ncbi:uncharacterized protein PAC_14364 [Phialocephala subalpina]|uniref:Uncharacterized protein n=1 Tax=Phialocephala subalpina TaxID=576137 RepID=A0A1L7XHN4_9HELO|nr:uncharacterized protein PAC_14364 [Phialocephala subalpina]
MENMCPSGHVHDHHDHLETFPRTAAEVAKLIAEYPETDPAKRRDEYFKLTGRVCRVLCENAQIAEWPTMPSADSSFTIFPELPEKVPSSTANASQALQYRPRYPPPVLQTCVEFREEALRAHELERIGDKQEDVARTEWIQYNRDVHIRDLDFSSPEHGYRDGEDNEWTGRPACFEHIETLAVNYDVVLPEIAAAPSLIRHFFPKLRVLLLLIDEEYEIEKFWSGNYHRYEMDQVAVRERQALAQFCRPPFKE